MGLPEQKPIGVYSTGTDLPEKSSIEYCTELQAEEGLFLDKYAERVFDALSTKKHSVLITGGRGTGKTTLVKYIQYLIDNYKCPHQFYEAKIYELSQLALGFGIKSIAEYEERMNEMFGSMLVMSEAGKIPILFIDNLSGFVSDNNINVMTALHLEHAISLNIPIICCCGLVERKQLESKYELMKNFTEIRLKEPVIEDVKLILKHKSKEFSNIYHTVVPDDVSDKIASLCDKYVKNGFCMPLKAVRVMENAVVRHMNEVHKPDSAMLKKINEIVKLRNELETSISEAKNGGDLLKLATKNIEVKNLEAYVRDSAKSLHADDTKVTDEDIYSVVSDVAGVPVAKLTESDTSKLKNMIPALTAKVIGQDETITKVCRTVKRNRLGLRKKNHTIGNFIFIGSTGVGKTFLAKKLAEYMFGSEESLIRLDMSEYTDEISVNKLIGAPPGYVGYGEGGVLCNAIKNNPYSVVLFDEIEKAHPAIFNTILQLMDEGRITDANGTHISATNTIVILTSNIGVKEAANAGNLIGFASDSEVAEKRNSDNKKSIIEKSMKKLFSPEFLNRIDSICYFNNLTSDNMTSIFDNEMDEVYESIKELGYKLKLSKEVKDWIVEKSEKEKMGARALIRNIQQDIVDEITEIIINEENTDKKEINVSVDKSKNLLKIKI